MTPLTVEIAAKSQEDQVVALMVLSFSADPVTRWVWPHPREYLTYYPPFVRAYASAAFAFDSAHCVAGGQGAAMWLPPGVHPDEAGVEIVMRESLAEARYAEVFKLLEQMETFHPKEPHWFLPLIGVDPLWQGKGCGSVLLQRMLSQCDDEGQLVYLDSTNVKNIPLYERHGFVVLGTVEAGSCPPVYPMLRRPQRVQ